MSTFNIPILQFFLHIFLKNNSTQQQEKTNQFSRRRKTTQLENQKHNRMETTQHNKRETTQFSSRRETTQPSSRKKNNSTLRHLHRLAAGGKQLCAASTAESAFLTYSLMSRIVKFSF
ncbi:hypothetical protein TNIN_273141 [Trichonephila inaurata madagascariensis]|uniref:Uncharacterized protein n=1 Tax=Trichonephila inaurata madagascariensis TaxID=2747483 RepID=A0A8X7CFD4_9ARAC|nr:hypothetical protein TNIN_273141 [Trichonephila inaurata madagascariensis]